jgi:ribonucleoside-triphosphate reductase
MVRYIRKRDGKVVDFNQQKISNAILAAMKEVYNNVSEETNISRAITVATEVTDNMKESIVDVETVQDIVEKSLMERFPDVARAYIKYRQERSRIRNMNSDINKHVKRVLACSDIQNSNANVDEYSFGGRKNEASNIIQKELALNEFIAPEIADAHRNNDIYIHDLSEYIIGSHNCLFVDLYKLLSNGFTTRNGDVRKANCFATACQLIAVIFQVQSQIQFGGAASANLDYELAPFVRISFLKHFKKGLTYVDRRKNKTWKDFEIKYNSVMKTASIISICNIFKTYSKIAYEYAYDMLEEEGLQSAQALYHNLNTLESRAGAQLPFTSLNVGLNTTFEGRKVTEWCLKASIDGIGKFNKTPIFPISIMKYKKDINDRPGTPN